MAQSDHANRYLVKYIFDFTDEELDEMEQVEFEKYLEQALKIKNPL